MNIFFLDTDPTEAAKMQMDCHVVKMILESAQMIATSLRHHGMTDEDCPVRLYKATHARHPSTLWAHETRSNFNWLCVHALELCDEYTRRYGKRHKSQDLIEGYCDLDHVIPDGDLTEFAVAISDEYASETADDTVVGRYRKYYAITKPRVMKKPVTFKGTMPVWFNEIRAAAGLEAHGE